MRGRAPLYPQRFNAAAVFLSVQPQLFGLLLSLPETGAEIPVKKFYTVFSGIFFADLPDEVVFLVGADKK